ncbi:MAG: hypothetical protein KF775_16095 [Cyclobacteriaceae bacterium]|nr:hypothetical protein [Cyclobacteriaceae bacterium]
MTPLFKKLNFKDHQEILVLNAPTSFDIELAKISELTEIKKDVKKVKTIDFSVIFVLTQEQIDSTIKSISSKLNGDVILWFCYPKGTSKKYKCNFNRDTGWEKLGNYNLEGVRQVAIDEDWSALRFRKVEFIKIMSRGESYAISREGKKRTKSKSGI